MAERWRKEHPQASHARSEHLISLQQQIEKMLADKSEMVNKMTSLLKKYMAAAGPDFEPRLVEAVMAERRSEKLQVRQVHYRSLIMRTAQMDAALAERSEMIDRMTELLNSYMTARAKPRLIEVTMAQRGKEEHHQALNTHSEQLISLEQQIEKMLTEKSEMEGASRITKSVETRRESKKARKVPPESLNSDHDKATKPNNLSELPSTKGIGYETRQVGNCFHIFVARMPAFKSVEEVETHIDYVKGSMHLSGGPGEVWDEPVAGWLCALGQLPMPDTSSSDVHSICAMLPGLYQFHCPRRRI